MEVSAINQNNGQVFYILGCMLLVGSKAIGLEERSWPFVMVFITGSLIIAFKMLFEAYSILELILFGILIGYGIYAFFNMGSIGLLSLIILLIGMKGVDVKRLFRYLSIEYTLCFLITILLSIFGNRDGVELVHEKFGMIVLRQSLGYTHPNVLHVTYVILMALILYTADAHGRKLFRLLGVLFLGDAFIFMYSLSSTGLLMSFALIAMFLYMELIHYRKGNEIPVFKMEKVLLYLWIPVSFFGFIILSRIVTLNNAWYVKANEIFNVRTWCINRYYDVVGLSLFGKQLNLPGVALDNSYAYGLFAYGILFIVLAFFSYLFTCRYLIRYNRFPEIAILIAMTFGGITEQFMFNTSLKNVTVFFVAEWLLHSRMISTSKKYIVLINTNKSLLNVNRFQWERLRGSISKKYINSLFISIVLITASLLLGLLIHSRDMIDTAYATPNNVDVGIDSTDKDDISYKETAYYIGWDKVKDNNKIYIFTEENSVIPFQLKLDKEIFKLYLVLVIVVMSFLMIRRIIKRK